MRSAASLDPAPWATWAASSALSCRSSISRRDFLSTALSSRTRIMLRIWLTTTFCCISADGVSYARYFALICGDNNFHSLLDILAREKADDGERTNAAGYGTEAGSIPRIKRDFTGPEGPRSVPGSRITFKWVLSEGCIEVLEAGGKTWFSCRVSTRSAFSRRQKD